MVSLVGYLSTLSAGPGDMVEVKVGSYGAKTYRADLRRIIQGDRNPQGPGYRNEPVELGLGGERPARRQQILPGSYVHVRDETGVLTSLRSFTIAVPVCPTRFGGEDRTVIRIASANAEISLDEGGKPTVSLGQVELKLAEPLALRRWSLLIVSFDSDKRNLRLSRLDEAQEQDEASGTAVSTQTALTAGEVLIAARTPGFNHFDGKIDSPAIFDRALETAETAALLLSPERLVRHPSLVAYWDFARRIKGRRIEDASPHRLDGTTHQSPARAITGWRWKGQCLVWQQRPDLYSAIHFHSDDMTDAGWQTDFAFRIPDELRSGVYSVRLVPDGDESDTYHCVFAVRPPREGTTGNDVCFLLPTASYLAYANHRIGLDVPGTEIGMGRLVEIDRHHAFLQEHQEMGFSFYEVHDDGSGVFYSSRNRPVLDIQPGIKGFLGGQGSNLWQFNADTHITGWLEHEGISYDVVTDEDLHREGLALLRRYRVVLTGTHPEYYSLEMLNAIQGFVDRGGRLMYLGGNGFYWRISFSEEHPGVIECRRSEVGIRPWEPGHGQFYHAFTGEYGGLWRRNGRSSGELTGLIMSSQGFDVSEGYILCEGASDPRAAFMFDGIDRTPGREFGGFGLSGGGAAGLELDRTDFSLGTPPHALVVATSTRHTDVYLLTPEELLDPTPDITGTQSDLIRADLTFFETPGGGAVFSVGSIAWAGAMAWNAYENEVSKLMVNVLRRFIDPSAFNYLPANR